MKSGASLQKLGPTKRAILISHHNPPGRGEGGGGGEGEAKKKEGRKSVRVMKRRRRKNGEGYFGIVTYLSKNCIMKGGKTRAGIGRRTRVTVVSNTALGKQTKPGIGVCLSMK